MIEKWEICLKELYTTPLSKVFESISASSFKKILYDNKPRPVKFRIFDDFLYPPIKWHTDYCEINNKRDYITANHIFNGFELPNNIGHHSWPMHLLYGNKVFHINGYYKSSIYLVFCGYPNIRTIIRSYLNSPQNTISKLKKCYNLSDQQIENVQLGSLNNLKLHYGQFLKIAEPGFFSL